MSDEISIQQAVDGLARQAQAALAAPGPAERELDELLARIESQTGLTAPVRREARRTLEGDRRALRDSRIAELGAQLQRALKPLGIEITARVVRRRRKRGAKATAPQDARQASAASSEVNQQEQEWRRAE